jgi:hypothetical protein
MPFPGSAPNMACSSSLGPTVELFPTILAFLDFRAGLQERMCVCVCSPLHKLSPLICCRRRGEKGLLEEVDLRGMEFTVLEGREGGGMLISASGLLWRVIGSFSGDIGMN